MLAYNKEGKICLEDADGSVVLDFSTLVNAFLSLRLTALIAVIG